MGWPRRAAIAAAAAALLAACFAPRPGADFGADGRVLLSRAMLQRPQYPLVIHAFNWCCKGLVLWAFPFERDPLIDEAVRRTGGLHGFWEGNRSYWESGLDAVLRAINTDPNTLSALGLLMAREVILEGLTNQLLVEDTIRRHPEIEAEEIRAPLVIAGVMRSGETNLQALLCQHPGLSHVTYFDVHHPVPLRTLPEGAAGTDADPRVQEVEIGVKIINWLRPLFPRMHRLGTTVPFEEIHYGQHVFGSTLFDGGSMYNIPSYTEWWQRVRIHTPAYQYIRRNLQLIQWRRGGAKGKRWLLKSPQNLEQVRAIKEVFPDAKFVMTHRDPVHVLRSMLSMGGYVMGIFSNSINTTLLGEYWVSRLRWWLDEAVSGYEHVNNSRQFLHVGFDKYMQDPLRIVQDTFQFAGLSYDDEVREAVERYYAAHPREGAKAFRYDLAEFDLVERDLVPLFARYNEFRRAHAPA